MGGCIELSAQTLPSIINELQPMLDNDAPLSQALGSKPFHAKRQPLNLEHRLTSNSTLANTDILNPENSQSTLPQLTKEWQFSYGEASKVDCKLEFIQKFRTLPITTWLNWNKGFISSHMIIASLRTSIPISQL